MICICIIAISCSHQQKTANRTAIIVKKTIVKCLNFHSKHRSVTDPAKHDPVDLFPSLNENLASPVSREIFNFTGSVCGFPGATFTFPAHIIWKSQNSVLTERGNLMENLPTRWRFFFRKPTENIDATGSVTWGVSKKQSLNSWSHTLALTNSIVSWPWYRLSLFLCLVEIVELKV